MGSLTKAEIVQFGAGGGASSAIFQFTTTYLLFFFTNISGIDASQAAKLILIMKLVDAIFDIVAAYIIDKFDLKFGSGKYRPYIAVFSPILGFSIYCLFSLDRGSSELSSYLAYLSVIAFSISLSFCNMAYNGLTVKMSSHYDERASLITCKQFIGIGVGFFASFLPLYISNYFGGGQEGWRVTALLMAILVVFLFYTSWLGSKHRDCALRDSGHEKDKISMASYLTILKENKPLVALMVCQSCFMFSITLEGSTAIYFFIYYLKQESAFPIYQGLVVGLSSLVILFAPRLIRYKDKKSVYVYSCKSAIIVLLIALYTILYSPVTVGLFFLVILKVLLVFSANLIWMLLPDCVDYGKRKYGVSPAAATQSLVTFFSKIFSGLGVFFAGAVLTHVGFNADSSTVPNQVIDVFLIFKFLPIFFALSVSVVAMKYYDIGREGFDPD
ncbi:MFS transporter [Vibrio sp. SCSIO 43135]|uniref:MFS transporter n=1 Tax=Vibrio sp. SCSIO 43135 TaxID=2819096 RepID=UPI002075911D|nr:MFS transporter [Vibrio sp. SCSIO 43135]USD43235.1 MFS transporter [Vibrio sp. SCSIO 43135]